MMNDDEHDLQRRFDGWSAQERDSMPDFERVWRRAERVATQPDTAASLARWRPRLAVVGVLVLFAAGVHWSTRERAESWDEQFAAFEEELDMLPLPDAEPTMEPGALELPTDFLLAGVDDNNSDRIRR
ncbi:MAG: hypothetical protein R3F13_05500 [Prosthecobacter sp.]